LSELIVRYTDQALNILLRRSGALLFNSHIGAQSSVAKLDMLNDSKICL